MLLARASSISFTNLFLSTAVLVESVQSRAMIKASAASGNRFSAPMLAHNEIVPSRIVCSMHKPAKQQ